MGTTIRLPNGKRTIICNDRHFVETLREYLSDDAAEWFQERVGQLNDDLEQAKLCILHHDLDTAYDILSDLIEGK